MNEIIWQSHYTKDQIRSILLEQFENFWQRDTGVPRQKLSEVEKALHLPHAVIISGLRRTGKSTLLAQIAHQLGKDKLYYLNFEDERFLGFRVEDANALFQTLVELFGERKIFLCDEIQNIPGWEYFVRRFMEMGYKFFITGSNASLLSRELGTRLTGRYVMVELFPFSFAEFLQFHEYEIPQLDRLTTVDRGMLNQQMQQYLKLGGIPDALKYPEINLLRTLYDDVLYRDIAARYQLTAINALRELAIYLFSNPAGLVSFNKIKERLRLGSVNTVSSYIEYMQNSWLIFTMNCYAYSLKQQQILPKKIYAIDTGMINAVGFHFSPNTGKLLENLAYLTLRRQTTEIYYLQTKAGLEVDFYLPAQRQLIQVAHQMENPATRDRELRAIEHAADEVPVENALILTADNEAPLQVGNVKIQVQAITEWLLR